jgi:uncharacterized protein YidB (DUF937 family)
MGLLDEVIRAAMASKPSAPQSLPPEGAPAQDPFSQIAVALQELLAPRQGAAPAAQARSARQPEEDEQGQVGGLDVLINQFKKNGLEDVVNSWIGTGQNKAISPSQLRQAIGQDTVNDLSRQTGAPQDDLLSQLSRYLPAVIDKLTPGGQLPNQADLQSGYRRR